MNLEAGCKKMPVKGLVNIDVSEAAAQLFDNAVISKILQMYKHYYDQRVMMSPDDYYNKMVNNKLGRLDLDGICPYTGENDEGSLKQPSAEQLMEWYDQKAAPTSWSQGKVIWRQAKRHDATCGEDTRGVREDDGVPRSCWIHSR